MFYDLTSFILPFDYQAFTCKRLAVSGAFQVETLLSSLHLKPLIIHLSALHDWSLLSVSLCQQQQCPTKTLFSLCSSSGLKKLLTWEARNR